MMASGSTRLALLFAPCCFAVALVHCSSSQTDPAGRQASSGALRLAFEPLPLSVGAGDTIPPVRVEIVDAAGHVVTSPAIAIVVAAARGALGGMRAAQADSGVATFATLHIDSPGVYLLRATAPALAPATSDTLTVRAPPGNGPRRVMFEAVPGAVVARDTMPPIRVDILDTLGHRDTTASDLVNIQINLNPGRGAIHGATTLNAVRGVATFTQVSIDSPGVGYTLRAIGDGMTGGASDRFAVVRAGRH